MPRLKNIDFSLEIMAVTVLFPKRATSGYLLNFYLLDIYFSLVRTSKHKCLPDASLCPFPDELHITAYRVVGRSFDGGCCGCLNNTTYMTVA